MKKIVFIVNHDVVIYNFRKEMVEEMLDSGYEVSIISPKGNRIDILEKMGCKFVEVDVDRHGINPIKDLFLINKYIKILRKIKPDYVLTFTVKPNIYGSIAASKLNIPFLVNITGLGTALENEGLVQKILILLYKKSLKNVDTVFFQNESNLNFFINENISNPNKFELLNGSGVNLEQFHPLEYPTSDVIKFVFISRIMKEKGIDQYLQAAKIIKNKYPNTEFHICGFLEDDYQETIEEYEKMDIITYHGMIMDIRDILKYTHCTIHPSYYPEGMSNVLLESSASARPVITTMRPGCKEIVDDNQTGYLFQEKNTEQLVEKIENFINLNFEEKKAMGISARSKMEKEFDRKFVTNAYMQKIKK